MAGERAKGEPDTLSRSAAREVEARPAEPPVIARLVVELRSDGRRTIARGALEDVELGQRVAVEAEGATPLALVLALAKAVLAAPKFAALAARKLLPGRGDPPQEKKKPG